MMPVFSFKLSMPGVNTWNGRWTGENRFYARTRCVAYTKSKDLEGYYRYSFGDGWIASVTVERVDAHEASKIRKKSVGFCGYEWMIDSILAHRSIKADG